MRIALFVVGCSPAIITETLAAKAIQKKNVADQVRVVTSRAGYEGLTSTLFEGGGWERFCLEWPEYKQTQFNIHTIFYPDHLDDIRSESENRSMAEMILTTLQRSLDESSAVDASIAGGRKTMGYYLGFGMSLLARREDTMTHVLVPEAWERDRNFLIPPRDEADRIELVDIPFIRLRNHLKPSVAKADMDTLIESAQVSIDLAAMSPIVLKIRPRIVKMLGKEIQMPEREFAIFQFFAQQKTRSCVRPDRELCHECRDCFLSIDDIDDKKEELLAARMQFGGVNDYRYVEFERSWRGARAAADNLHEPLRRINALIEKHFATDAYAQLAMIRNINAKQRGNARYGILADKKKIMIERE